MTTEELPVVFACGRARLLGLLHMPRTPKRRGVVVIAGAPQYRVGCHRQFLLLARDVAAAGFPVLRFDYRGVGDSDGDFVGFEGVSDDIAAAVDALFAHVPGLADVVLWGLCDGASAISFHAARDSRVSGIVLVNPWVRSEQSLARTRVRRYYRDRLSSREFWRKLATGNVDLKTSARELTSGIRRAFAGREASAPGPVPSESLPLRVGRSLRQFRGRCLLLLSEADITAQEFETAVLESPTMADWLNRSTVTVKRLAGANHTYSTRAQRGMVHEWTIEWLGHEG